MTSRSLRLHATVDYHGDTHAFATCPALRQLGRTQLLLACCLIRNQSFRIICCASFIFTIMGTNMMVLKCSSVPCVAQDCSDIVWQFRMVLKCSSAQVACVPHMMVLKCSSVPRIYHCDTNMMVNIAPTTCLVTPDECVAPKPYGAQRI